MKHEDRLTEALVNNGKITPLCYLFDEQGFIDNYKTLEDTFLSMYPGYRISYSFKTNYTPHICRIVRRLGGYAEVVSDMEYELAKCLGYPNNHIVYNGPAKGDEIYEHLEAGGILNIDSFDEAVRVADYCKAHPGRQYATGLRINMDLGGDFISRFGMEPGSRELEEAVELIRRTENLSLVGLHCHISRSRGAEAWAKRALIMIEAADRYIDGVPEYISLGSGMYADMQDELRDQFGGDTVPTYRDYAECAIRPIAEHYRGASRKPLLFTEPGTTVVARYISFATRIQSIKQVRGRYMANMDGSYLNLGEICTMKQLPVTVLPSGRQQSLYPGIDIMGYTCLEQDLMRHGLDRPIAVGDTLIFGNTGGYSIVSKPPFIKPQCAMYSIDAEGGARQIMRAETFDDVFGRFLFE